MQKHHLHHARKKKEKKKGKKKALRGNFLRSSLRATTMRCDETAAAAGYLRGALLQQREQSLPVFLFFALFEGFQGQRCFLVLFKWKEINYRSALTNRSSGGAARWRWIWRVCIVEVLSALDSDPLDSVDWTWKYMCILKKGAEKSFQTP